MGNDDRDDDMEVDYEDTYPGPALNKYVSGISRSRSRSFCDRSRSVSSMYPTESSTVTVKYCYRNDNRRNNVSLNDSDPGSRKDGRRSYNSGWDIRCHGNSNLSDRRPDDRNRDLRNPRRASVAQDDKKNWHNRTRDHRCHSPLATNRKNSPSSSNPRRFSIARNSQRSLSVDRPVKNCRRQDSPQDSYKDQNEKKQSLDNPIIEHHSLDRSSLSRRSNDEKSLDRRSPNRKSLDRSFHDKTSNEAPSGRGGSDIRNDKPTDSINAESRSSISATQSRKPREDKEKENEETNGSTVVSESSCQQLESFVRDLTEENLQLHNALHNQQNSNEISEDCHESTNNNNNENNGLTLETPKDRQGAAWTHLDKLQKLKKCHHCQKSRWQHSYRPICEECQPTLERKTCQHCREEFLQHNILKRAEVHFARPICLQCARNVRDYSQTYGLPRECGLCKHIAAWGPKQYCDRCTENISKYGEPESCSRCSNKAAFRREPEKLEKVDNLMLCFDCTINYKREKYKSQKKNRRLLEASKPKIIDTNLSEKIELYKKEIEKHKALVESYKTQISQAQKQVKKQDADVMNFAKQMEQENSLLQREAEEYRRKSARDEQRIAQLLKEIADVDKTRDKEITKLIEAHHEERDKFNELIDNLKSENEQLLEEVDKKIKEIKEAKNVTKDEQKANDRYKGITEKRVKKLSEKYLKVISKHEERAKERNKIIANLRRENSKLRGEHQRLQLVLEKNDVSEKSRKDEDTASKSNGEGYDNDILLPLVECPQLSTLKSEDDSSKKRAHEDTNSKMELPSKRQRGTSRETLDNHIDQRQVEEENDDTRDPAIQGKIHDNEDQQQQVNGNPGSENQFNIESPKKQPNGPGMEVGNQGSLDKPGGPVQNDEELRSLEDEDENFVQNELYDNDDVPNTNESKRDSDKVDFSFIDGLNDMHYGYHHSKLVENDLPNEEDDDSGGSTESEN